MNYKSLFSPIKIGTLELNNRMVMPAMDTGLDTPEHTLSDQAINYYAERSKGGFGLVITEFLCVEELGYAGPTQPSIASDDKIDNLTKLTTAVHKGNAKIFAQLHHSGAQTSAKVIGVEPLSPSGVPHGKYREKVHAMSNEEVYRLIDRFIEAGVRAKKSGFDGVEVHCAHGYLINQFASKYFNKRTDEFGGSVENRMRFATEVIKGIKKANGNDYPVTIRFSADELLESGNTIEDVVPYAMLAEEAGADAIHVSYGTGVSGGITTPYFNKPAFNVENAAKIKAAVSIPVIAVGRINSPIIAETIIRTGKADLVSLGRQSICDPHFPEKVKNGEEDTIFQCTGCMQRCYHYGTKGGDELDKGVSCMINPFSGKEGRWEITKTTNPRKVTIIGGGVAGLEAAWILGKRGFDVKVVEKSDTLGGQIKYACVPPHKNDFAKIISTYKALADKYNVKFELNTEFNDEYLSKDNADVYILATGAKPITINFYGIDSLPSAQANDILCGNEVVCGKKVLVVGGGLVGCETAEFLTSYGNNVTIVEMGPEFAAGGSKAPKLTLLARLKQAGVTMLPNTKLVGITENEISCFNGEEVKLSGFQYIVFALGSRSENTMKEKLASTGKEYYVLGDANAVKDARFAIFDAAKLSINL